MQDRMHGRSGQCSRFFIGLDLQNVWFCVALFLLIYFAQMQNWPSAIDRVTEPVAANWPRTADHPTIRPSKITPSDGLSSILTSFLHDRIVLTFARTICQCVTFPKIFIRKQIFAYWVCCVAPNGERFGLDGGGRQKRSQRMMTLKYRQARCRNHWTELIAANVQRIFNFVHDNTLSLHFTDCKVFVRQIQS
jgi:hypothetical protein